MLNYPVNISDEKSVYSLNENSLNGYYPIGVGNFWHSGIHIPVSSDDPIKPLISGKAIAYRISKYYEKVDLPQKLTKEKLNEKYSKHKNFYVEKDGVFYINEKIPSSERKINLASNFILLEHCIADSESKNSLKFYTLYTNIASSSKKDAYQESFITDGKIHVLKDEDKFFCNLIGPAGLDRDEKYIEISCFMEKSLFDVKFTSRKLVFKSTTDYKDFYSRENIECKKANFYFTNRSRYVVKEIINSGQKTAKKVQITGLAAYLPGGVDTIGETTTTIKDVRKISSVILNTITVEKGQTSNFNLIGPCLDNFFSSCKNGNKYTVTKNNAGTPQVYNGQTQILIDCSASNVVWIVDNNNFSSELDKEFTYSTNGNVEYYQECPFFYSFNKKIISEIDNIKGLTSNICLDKNKKEYCELDGLSEVYVDKKSFESKCYENALNWKAFFDNQEEFQDDIFCDKIALLKEIDESSVLKDIFRTNRMISDDEMKMFFGPNEHSLEMKEVVKKLRKVECTHPLEFDSAKFDKIEDEYDKRKEWTMGSMSESSANALRAQTKIRDIWTDGLCNIFKKNNFFFVHPVYFLNHLDKAGLFEFNPYAGMTYESTIKDISSLNKVYNRDLSGSKKTNICKLPASWKVESNPGFSTMPTDSKKKITEGNAVGYGKITGLFNEDYLQVTRFTIDGVKYPYSVYRNYYYHFGLDFSGSSGDPIISLIYGRVIAKCWISSNGRCLLIQGKTTNNLYMLCHLKSYSENLKEGDEVFPGKEVAKVGTSGGSSGSYSETSFAGSDHLHLSVIKWNTANIKKTDILEARSEISIKGGGKETHYNLKSRTYLDPFNYKYEGGWMENKTNDDESSRSLLEKNYRNSLKS